LIKKVEGKRAEGSAQPKCPKRQRTVERRKELRVCVQRSGWWFKKAQGGRKKRSADRLKQGAKRTSRPLSIERPKRENGTSRRKETQGKGSTGRGGGKREFVYGKLRLSARGRQGGRGNPRSPVGIE